VKQWAQGFSRGLLAF
jgi:ribonuclease HI